MFWPAVREVGDRHPWARTPLSPCLAVGLSSSQCLAVPQAGPGGRVWAKGGLLGGSANEPFFRPGPELANRRELGWRQGQSCRLTGRLAKTALVFKPCLHEVSKTCWTRQTILQNPVLQSLNTFWLSHRIFFHMINHWNEKLFYLSLLGMKQHERTLYLATKKYLSKINGLKYVQEAWLRNAKNI